MIRLLTTLLALTLLGGIAAAQLDLPKAGSRKKIKRRPIAGLELPSSAPRKAAPSAVEETPDAEEAASRAASPGDSVGGDDARALLATLADTRGSDGPAVRAVVEELLTRGDLGLAAARASLAAKSAAERVAAVRVCLASGRPEDRQHVHNSLRQRVPSRAADALVEALIELDPVGASPAFFAELLDHSQGAVRSAAQSALFDRLAPEVVPILARRFASRRGDTRERILDLAIRIDDPAARDLLFRALGDENARVASRAARLLARCDVPGVEARLLDEVTSDPSLLREGSYALLAIVEREDERGHAILGQENVDLLLANLAGTNELARGAAACALAGIGFRTPRGATDEDDWLDLIVPHHLVRAVAATSFHRDFGSLQRPAQRRLALLAGFSLGSDGPAWQRWWSDAASTFRARRALIEVGRDEVDLMWLTLRDGDESLALAGERAPPVSAAPAFSAQTDEPTYITRAECLDLLRALEREGVLGAERLPNSSSSSAGERVLTVGVGQREKRFVEVDGAAWFERVVAFARSLHDANRWQSFLDPEQHASRRELWVEQREFWVSTDDPVGRGRRASDLAIGALSSGDRALRKSALLELEGQFSVPGVPDAGDVRPFVELLSNADLRADEVDGIVSLAIRAARADALVGPGRAIDAGAEIDVELAGDLAVALATRFGTDVAPQIARVLEARDPTLAVELATHPNSALRAAAALALGNHPSPEALEALLDLMSDPNELVEAAAVTGLGVQLRARPDIAVGRFADPLLARTGDPALAVRVAALRALPGCRDERAIGALLAGTADVEVEARIAAAEGLAALEDPSTVSILVSMLASGPESELFGPARDGLRRLGPAAHEELLRALRRGSSAGRGLAREAALLLAEDGLPEAVSPLLSILTDDPSDARVAWELAVLSCVDFRDHPDPAGAWWEWWDLVVHDDATAWLVAAGARAGLDVSHSTLLSASGDVAASAFLFDLAVIGAPHVALRARRELEARLGRELTWPDPAEEAELRRLREELLAEWSE